MADSLARWFRVHGNGSRHWVRIGSTRVALISSVKCTSLIRPPRFPSKSLFFPTSLSPPRFSCSLFCFHSFRTLLLPPRFPSLPTPTPSSFLPFPPYPIRAFRSPSISLSLFSPLFQLPSPARLLFSSAPPSRFQEYLRRSQMSLRSGIDASPFF